MEISKPWVHIYLGESYIHTSNLGTLETGAWYYLILSYWANGYLPMEDDRLAIITKLSLNDWLSIKNRLKPLFSDGGEDEWVSHYWDKKRNGKVSNGTNEEGRREEISEKRRAAVAKRKDRSQDTSYKNSTKSLQKSYKNSTKNSGISLSLSEYRIDNSFHSLSIPHSESEKVLQNSTKNFTKTQSEVTDIQLRLCSEAGNSPCISNPDISPIIRLMAAGYELESHIIPVLRDLSRRENKPKSWGYVAAAIQGRAIKPSPVAPISVGSASDPLEELSKKFIGG